LIFMNLTKKACNFCVSLHMLISKAFIEEG
jgi:hypothetical protein